MTEHLSPDLRAALPLTAEEEADYREHFIDGSGAFTDSHMIARLLRTLDQVRASLDSETRDRPRTDAQERVAIECSARLSDALDALRAAVLWLHGEYRDKPRSEFNAESWYRKARSGIVGLTALPDDEGEKELIASQLRAGVPPHDVMNGVRARSALAAPTDTEPSGLDVERLARALHIAEYGEPPARDGNANIYKARLIAGAYDATSSRDSTENQP